MNRGKNDWFIWIPRILGILIASFMFLFSFDCFEGVASFWNKAGCFLIHNLPCFLLLLIIILLWHQPLWTGVVLLCLGALFTMAFRTYEQFNTFMLISLPVFVAGALFIWASFRKKKIIENRQPEQREGDIPPSEKIQ